MALKTGTRVGGRGCPSCGSHNTEGLGRGAVQWCHTCDHRWQPCSPGCKGYEFELDLPDGPQIIGCVKCGVPDRIARQWPEAYRAIAKLLDGRKLEAIA